MKALKLIGGLCLAVPMLGVLAFGPDKTVRPPKDTVVVEYWEKWTGDEGAALKRTVDDFNDTVGKDKGIFVNVLTTSGVVQKTLVATSGGVPPDVAGLWEPAVPQLAALGVLEPLDDLAAAHGIGPSTYKRVFWQMCKYDDKLYALISTPYCYALYYNTQIFHDNADKLRAAGLDPDRAPVSIDELDRYAKALDVINPDGTIQRTGYLPMEPGWDLTFSPYQFGGDWWDAGAKKFAFTSPEVVEAFTWAQGYAKRLGQGAVSEFRSSAGNYDSPQNPFLSGTTAIETQGTYFANAIHNQRPQMDGKWAAAPLPTKTPELYGTTSCTADVLVIPKGAKHPKEAFEFIAWLNTQGPMEKLCNAHCKISPLAKVSDDFLTHHKNPYIGVFEKMADGPLAHPTPQIETMPDVSAELTVFVTELSTLRVTPEAGLAAVQERMQKVYDDFKRKQALYTTPSQGTSPGH